MKNNENLNLFNGNNGPIRSVFKRTLMALFAVMLLGFTADAHTWEIRVNQNQDGSLTWYIQSYHTSNESACYTYSNQSGITINNVNYPIQTVGNGDISLLSPTIFGVYQPYAQYGRGLYGIINTPFLGTTLSVAPYSSVACWQTPPGFVSNGNFTPPPPPVCTSCPLTGFSNTVALPGNNNMTPCDPTDDFTSGVVTVNHLACASITGDGQFSLVFDPGGDNVAYGPFTYSTGITTDVTINIPYGTSNSTQINLVDADFPCSLSQAMTGGSYNGEVDAVPPTISCPADMTVNNDNGNCDAVVTFAATGTDNCGSPTITYSQNPGTVFGLGTTPVTATATDAAGNQVSCTFNITVVDSEIPEFNGGGSSNAADYNFSTTTGVSLEDISTGSTLIWGSGYDDYTSTIAIPFTFNYLNSDHTTIDVNTNGVLVPGGTGGYYSYSNNTNNSGVTNALFPFWDDLTTGSNGSVHYKVVGTAPNRKLVIEFKNNLYNGGSYSSSPFTITFQAWLSEGSNAIQYVYGANTNSSNNFSATIGLKGSSSSDFNEVTTSNTNSTTSINDNYNMWPGNGRSFTFTPSDCPPNISVNTDIGICGAGVPYTAPGFTDNCPGASIAQTAGLIGGATFPVGITTNTFVVTDAAMNSNTCSFTVTVTDNENPVVACPADVTVNCQDDNSSASTGTASATDNCGVAGSVTESDLSTQDPNPANSSHYNYTITRTWSATNVNSNIGSCNQVITVQDVTNPSISCPADITVSNDQGNCDALVTFAATGTDNCSPVSITYSQNPGTVFNLGTTAVTATSTDVSGNSVSCTFNVTVEDNENPTITCPGNATMPNQAGTCGSTYTYAVTSTDNCPGEVITQTDGLPSGSIFPVGTTTNTFVVTDGNNNTATCSFDVTVAFDPATVVAYTILAEDDIHLHEDNIVSGNVGVWKANKKAKLHKQSHIYGFLQAPDIDLKDGSTVSGSQTLAQAPMPTAASFRYNTMSSNVDVNVPDNYVGVYQITGNNFDKIDIGKNATVQFMNTGDIFIKELKSKGDNNSTTSILFSGNTDLMIKKKMELKKATDFNQVGGYTVNVYCEDGNVKIDENSNITANIDVRFKKLDVHGKSGETTYMNGSFIAEKVHGHKDVVWNGACTGPSNTVPSSRESSEPIAEIVTTEGLSTEVYPNPNNGVFSIMVRTSSTEQIRGAIYEISGKKVSNLPGIQANTQYNVTNNLSNGVYFINIQVGTENQSVKMIKKD